MADVQIKRIEEIPHYTGPKAIPGIKFHTAARELGVTAWGMSVLEIEAGCDKYFEHDHVKAGQEEVYVVLKGSATVKAGEVTQELTEGTLVRVGPSVKRKFLPGPQGVT